MPGPFAALEARVDTAVVARLANATAVFAAEEAAVLLDAPDTLAFDAAADVAAVMHCPTTVFPALARGDTLAVDGADYRVLSAPLADAGLKRVLLGRA